MCSLCAFISLIPRLRALTFYLSPFPSAYEKIKGPSGGERENRKKKDLFFVSLVIQDILESINEIAGISVSNLFITMCVEILLGF